MVKDGSITYQSADGYLGVTGSVNLYDDTILTPSF